MNPIRYIPIPWFRSSLLATYGLTGEEAYAKISERYDLSPVREETIEMMKSYVPKKDSAMTLDLSKYHCGQIVLLPKKPNSDVIPHEAVHVVANILAWIGLDLTNQTDEVYAYGVGFVCDELK